MFHGIILFIYPMSYTAIFTRRCYLPLMKDEEPVISNFAIFLRRFLAMLFILFPFGVVFLLYDLFFKSWANITYAAVLIVIFVSFLGYALFAFY